MIANLKTLPLMIFIISKYLVPKNYRGITIFPFIILKSKTGLHNPVVVNHERIHFRQQLEMLVLLFYIWYGTEFLIRFMVLRNWNSAYRNISFEKEAYANERNDTFLRDKKVWSFLQYL